MDQPLNEIQKVVNQILNVNSSIRRKKKTKEQRRKDLFIATINSLEGIINRQNLMYAELKVDLSSYDEAFLEIIDSLIVLSFGKDGAELIAYYLWERITPDGTIAPLVDADGNEVVLKTVLDLWNLLIEINPAYGDQK